MANCLRWFAEDKARLNIEGSFDIYPWSFKHASFLINRFRVLDGSNRASFELATGHPYGKLALFGERVLFKRAVRNKGSAVFEKGVWVTKHPWNDNHVVLSATGAYEASILMKHAGQAQRYRQPTLEMEASEELAAIAQDVATGVVTPAPGRQPMTPGITLTSSGPSTTAAPKTPTNAPMKRQLSEEEKSEGEREREQEGGCIRIAKKACREKTRRSSGREWREERTS